MTLHDLKLHLYRKLQLHLKQQYSREHGDRKCSHCATWESANEIDGTPNEYTFHSWGYTATCGRCSVTTHWNNIVAPLALRCTEDGTPLPQDAPPTRNTTSKNNMAFFIAFYEKNRIPLLQYKNLRQHFAAMHESVLGKDYYTDAHDVYAADKALCLEVTRKAARSLWQHFLDNCTEWRNR